jgi:hypothetical protein
MLRRRIAKLEEDLEYQRPSRANSTEQSRRHQTASQTINASAVNIRNTSVNSRRFPHSTGLYFNGPPTELMQWAEERGIITQVTTNPDGFTQVHLPDARDLRAVMKHASSLYAKPFGTYRVPRLLINQRANSDESARVDARTSTAANPHPTTHTRRNTTESQRPSETTRIDRDVPFKRELDPPNPGKQ